MTKTPWTFLSVCSGIEALSVATEEMGWQPVAFAEVAPFPSAVLAHHYPAVPNLGDITQYESWTLSGPIRLLCGGTPCQAFSQAGDREGITDARGNLCLTFCNIADKWDPEWTWWENVPGVLNMPDNSFGCMVGKLSGHGHAIQPPGGRWPDAGIVSGPKRTIAWRVLDAQYFGLAQRRRRVLVIAVRGHNNWRSAAALFPVGDGVRWDPKTCESARSRITAGALRSTDGGSDPNHAAARHIVGTLQSRSGGQGFRGSADDAGAGHIIAAAFSGANRDIANCITAREGKGADSDATTTLIVQGFHAAGQYGFTMSQVAPPIAATDGGGAGVPCIIAFEPRERGDDGRGYGRAPSVSFNVAPTLNTVKTPCIAIAAPVTTRPYSDRGAADESKLVAVSFRSEMGGNDGGIYTDGTTATLTTGGPPAMAFRHLTSPTDTGVPQIEMAPTLRAADKTGLCVAYANGSFAGHPERPAYGVRRLMPVECARLQGFPDTYLDVPYRGKAAADGPKYEALGNSMAVNCMRWLARRIEYVDANF